MPLINTSVTNLIQGVSQQPDSSRFSGQCETQENAFSSVVDGLKKRPNTKHIVKLLGSEIGQLSFVHFINRSDEEKYVTFINKSSNKLYAFNALTGAECTINGNLGGFTIESTHYLRTTDYLQDIRALTIADNTFLLNTTKQVQESTTLTPALLKDAFIAFNQGDYEKRYEVEIGRSNRPKIIFYWMLYSNGDGYLDSFDIISSGYGIDTSNYLMGNGENTGFVPTFDAEGRVVSGTLTKGTYRWPAWKLTGRNQVVTYRAGITEIDESHYDRLTVVSGKSSNGKNADTNVLAQNLVHLVDNTSIAPTSRVAGMTDGNLQKISYDATKVNFAVTSVGHIVRFKWKGSVYVEDFTIRTHDPLGGRGIQAVYKEVSSISSLPLIAPNDFVVKVIGDADYDQDNYYVKFVTTDGSVMGNGTWQETVGSSVSIGLKANTLPMKLVSTGLNTFTLEEVVYDPRNAGDGESNPAPSFVNKTINNMVFFKNRLGFLTDDSIVLSDAGNFFNFYRNTVSTLLDSAPIDVAIASTRVAKLTAAVGFQENLLIFGDNAQFVMKGGDILTPKTVSVSPVTNFSFDNHDTPLVLGSYVYFPFTRGSYTGVREYTVNANTDTYDSAEITEHVPAYIPADIIRTAGTTAENIFVVVSRNEHNAIYIYKYFWENNSKVLSSWSKFIFKGEIRGVDFLGSSLSIVLARDGNTNLVEMELNSGEISADPYLGTTGINLGNLQILMDDRIEVRRTANSNLLQWKNAAGTWVSLRADWAYSVYSTDIANYKFVPMQGPYKGKIENLSVATAGFSVSNGSPLTPAITYGYMGRPYTMKYTFSTQLFKAGDGKNPSPSSSSALNLRSCSLFYDKTKEFEVTVSQKNRSDNTVSFDASTDPNAIAISDIAFSEGFFRFGLHGKAQDINVSVYNRGIFNSKLNSAEFESFVSPRSSRYG
jgi:hypothetical protein